jgi:phytoene dehydrogenase-like protein
MGGELRTACRVERIEGIKGDFTIHTQRGDFRVAQVVSAVPAALTARIAPPAVNQALKAYLERDQHAQGSAIVVFLGVPDDEVAGQAFTHHQLFQNYSEPLGNGNNMFISVSAPGDTASAPAGYRAVMISTHCELEPWYNLIARDYAAAKQAIGDQLVRFARRVYPQLGEKALVYEIATPRTYEKFTGRPHGAVGGVRQSLANANQNALPHDLGIPGFWMVGDSTWPGLGTVACVLGSRIVAEGVLGTRCPIRSQLDSLP